MIAAALTLAAAVAFPEAGACTLCHPDVRVPFEESVHRAERITCVSCHGGNPRATTVAAAHSGGYLGVARRRDIPALCASCHADTARMRPYNLPTDQYALYQTSQHGRALQKGDDRVAVCTDCHGTHDIRRRDDPKSRVFQQNIPATCGRCHADSRLMGRYGKRADTLAAYSGSVHGRALLEERNPQAPDCARCHGAHGAAPPGIGNIDVVCGQCHATTRAYFLEGPHKAAMDAAGHPECASCHDPHATRGADLRLLDEVCARCHAPGSPQREMAATFATLYAGTEEALEAARLLVDRAASVPLHVEDYRARLEEARTSLLEAFPAMHALSVARVEHLAERGRAIAEEVTLEASGKLEARAWRRVGLLVFWFYVILTLVILVRGRRRAARGAGA